MKDLESYTTTWWLVVVPPWLLTILLYGLLSIDTRYFVAVEVYHHLTLLLPLLASSIAGRRLRARLLGRKQPAPCTVQGPSPVWAVPMFVAYGAMTLIFFVLIRWLYYAAFFGIAVGFLCRLAFNGWWLSRCARSVQRVAFLGQVTSHDGAPRFVLRTLEGIQSVRVDAMDDGMVDFTSEDGTTSEAWQVLIPSQGLIDAVGVANRKPVASRVKDD